MRSHESSHQCACTERSTRSDSSISGHQVDAWGSGRWRLKGLWGKETTWKEQCSRRNTIPFLTFNLRQEEKSVSMCTDSSSVCTDSSSVCTYSSSGILRHICEQEEEETKRRMWSGELTTTWESLEAWKSHGARELGVPFFEMIRN